MKFNIEIDLDWVGEDSSISEEIQNQIMANVENRISKTLMESIKTKVEEKLNDAAYTQVRDVVSNRIKELLEKPRTITDKYGDVIKENWTLETMLTEEVEKAFDAKVFDSEGKRGGYGAKYSVVDFTIKSLLEPLVERRVKELTDQTKKHIEQLVSDKIKTQVADKLTSLIVENSSSLSLKSN